MTPLAAVFAGVAAGWLHVASGPDHFAAVLPYAVGDRRAARVGAAWGVGHGLGVLLLVALGQLARPWIDLARISGGAEIAVGVLLIALGGVTLRRALAAATPHAHDHAHDHDHVNDPAPTGHDHGAWSSLGFGVLHGLGGASHLIAALPTLALTRAGAIAYLGGYLGAAVGWMGIVSAVAGIGLADPRRARVAQGVSGGLAVAVGLYWLGAA